MWSAVVLTVGGVVVTAWAVALVLYDVRYRRLPDWLTLPAAAVALVGSVAYSGFSHSPWWGLFWPAAYCVLAVAKSGIGGGDLKLAVPLGLSVAAVGGLFAVLAAMAIASTVTVCWAVATDTRSGPHGPGMLAGALLAGVFSVSAGGDIFS